MKLVKYLPNEYEKASRDKREVTAAIEVGYDVLVISPKEYLGLQDGFTFARLKGVTLSSAQNAALRKIYIVFNFCSHMRQLRRLECDVVSCHDLGCLQRVYFATRFKRSKPALVYDAHELETARNVGGGPRGALSAWLVARAERFLMRRAAFTIAVNDSIADEMQRMHAPVARPVVVRSTPPYWERDERASRLRREELCARLGVDPDEAFLLMYHGCVSEGRGVEQVLRLVGRSGDPRVAAVVMGDGSRSYLSSLQGMAESLGVSSRALFLPAVPRDGLEAWVSAADLEFVILENICKNHFYTLPNKFFEAVQAEVPLIVSDFPETSRLVREYGIGAACDPADLDALAAAVERMRSDAAFYGRCKSNLLRAKADLCWENERLVLEDAYLSLAAKIG